ncbi:MAG: pilus assembly protein [Acidobacteriia bacterium]|nr:pilus assembly protein [Terriglobia bacterium]
MRRERGHAMIELALSATVMITCLAGTFQFGYTFYVYNQLVTAIGNGGRYAATRTLRAEPEKAEKAIRNMVVYGDAKPATGAAPVVAGLTPEQVDVRWVRDGSGAPTAVDVAIREYKVDAVFKTFTFEGRPGVEFPYVGRFAPSEHEQ